MVKLKIFQVMCKKYVRLQNVYWLDKLFTDEVKVYMLFPFFKFILNTNVIISIICRSDDII